MKKYFVALMALAVMAGAASCSKDEDSNDNPGGGGSSSECTIYEEHLGEGLYQPKLHMSSVEENGTAVSTFVWSGNQLTNMTTGGSSVAMAYTNDGHLKSSSYQGTTYSYSYNGNETRCVRMTGFAGLMAHIDVIHQNGHITELAYDSVSTLYLMQLASQYLDLGMKDGRKYSFGEASIDETFDWTGNNVSEHTLTGEITIGVSPSELSAVVDVEDLIRSYLETNYPSIVGNQMLSGLIDQLIGIIASDTAETPVDVKLIVDETFAYDSQRNYLQYLWPTGIQAIGLSANNPTNSKQAVTLNATAHYSLPSNLPTALSAIVTLLGVNSFDIPINREISNTSDNFTYQYNSHNFPIKVKSANYGEITIKYN